MGDTHKYRLLEEQILRDNLTVAIEREIFEGSDCSVIFDLTSLTSDEIERALHSEFQKSMFCPFQKILPTMM